MSLLQLLQEEKIQEFNARRGQRVTLDFFAVDLSGRNLAGVDLSGANLEKADLTGCDLTGAVLAKANLSGADLTRAKLARCVAVRARFREAYMGEADASDGEFSGADFTDADLSGFVARQGRFGGARFKGAVLTNANLSGSDFAEGRLGDVDLRNADLSGANFRLAEMPRANLSGAHLERACLRNARLGGAVFRNAFLQGAELIEADLSASDFAGAAIDGATFQGADLFDIQGEPDLVARIRGVQIPVPAPVGVAALLTGLHIDDPALCHAHNMCAILWENADSDEVFTVRLALAPVGRPFTGETQMLPVPADQVLSRGLLPSETGFHAVLFVERPGGVELQVIPVSLRGELGEARSLRLGYAPVVKPILVPDEGGFLIFGIGRQGSLSVHRYEGDTLTELLRAPSNTYRGFCGRREPVLLGKGGTLAVVRRDGIGQLFKAPAGYPGRLTAASLDKSGERIGVAWSTREDRGIFFQCVQDGTPPVRLDARSEIGSIDLAAVGDRWLVVWTRELAGGDERAAPMAAWVGGKPFPLLSGEDAEEAADVRIFATSPVPMVAVTTFAEEVRLIAIDEAAGRLVGSVP